jgi:integrase
MAPNLALKLVGPINEKRTVGRKANAEYRTREHLTEGEVERLIETTKHNRHGHRDATMLLLAFRHGGQPNWWTFAGSR